MVEEAKVDLAGEIWKKTRGWGAHRVKEKQ